MQRSTCENLWLTYVRMLGMPSALCISITAVLHQLECKLRDEPTHWGSTILLVGAGVAMAGALWLGTSKGTRPVVIALFVCGSVLLCGMGLMELCEEHWALYLVLLGIAAVTCFTVVWSQHEFAWPLAMRESDVRSVPQGSDATKTEEQQSVSLHDSRDGDSVDETVAIESEGVDAQRLRRPAWAKYAIGIVLGGGFLIYMIVVPAIGILIAWLIPDTRMSRELTEMSFSESLRLHAVSGVVTLLFFAMGASIGSFLNVVIYRLPRRRQLFWPPSACPNCKTKISGKDNVPVLAWLRLGGRCRNCHVAISARYPIVEALVGGLFVVFYYRELLSGGANLPVRSPNSYNGIVWILLYTKWDLVSLYFFHMLLLVLLLAWGMINYDRFRVPWLSILLTTIVFIILLATFPHLNPTIAAWRSIQSSFPPAVLATIAGFLGGGCLGLVLEFLDNRLAAFLPRAEELFAEDLIAEDCESQNSLTMELSQPALGSELACARAAADNRRVETAALDAAILAIAPSIASQASSLVVNSDESAASVELYGTISQAPALSSNVAASLALVGAALGIEAVLAIVALALPLYLASIALSRCFFGWRNQSRRKVPIVIAIFVATAFSLVFWNQLYLATRSLLSGGQP